MIRKTTKKYVLKNHQDIKKIHEEIILILEDLQKDSKVTGIKSYEVKTVSMEEITLSVDVMGEGI